MFKDFDFEKFSQELEKELAKEDVSGKPFIPETSEKPFQNDKKPTDTKVDTHKKTTTAIPKDPETLFLNPPMEETSVAGKKMLVPVKKARENAVDVINDFVNQIRKLELKLSAMSPEVRETYEIKYRSMVDQMVIAAEFITSKKVYQAMLLETPQFAGDTKHLPKFMPKSKDGGDISAQETQDLRKMILSARKKALNLIATIKDETLHKQKEEYEKEQLEKFAQPQRDIPSLKPIKPATKHSKRKGMQKKEHPKKIKQFKKIKAEEQI